MARGYMGVDKHPFKHPSSVLSVGSLHIIFALETQRCILYHLSLNVF
jgi:hypothetical protein